MLMLYSVQDFLEVLFFSVIVYKLSSFIINNNKNANRAYWYYTSLITFTYMTSLNNTLLFLLLISPIVIILFIVLHHEAIQKNFLASKTTISKSKTHDAWTKIIIRDCMLRMHSNQATQCIIQTNYDITSLVDNPYPTPIKLIPGLITFLGNSSNFDSDKFLLMDQDGFLQGINIAINMPEHTNTSWFEAAYNLTTKLNILMFKTSTETQTFDIVIAGELMCKKTAAQTQDILDNFLNNSLSRTKGSRFYDNQYQNRNKQI